MSTATAYKSRASLVESVASRGQVDRDAGVIRNVKVLGRTSRNGREYSERALQEACALYANCKVNVDHPERSAPNKERSFRDGFGVLRSPRVKAEGVFADLHFLRAHPMAEQVCEAAERFPNSFGLSHNSDGHVVSRGGRAVVESIVKVRSVDIVGVPASTSGIFESFTQESSSMYQNQPLRGDDLISAIMRKPGAYVPIGPKRLREMVEATPDDEGADALQRSLDAMDEGADHETDPKILVKQAFEELFSAAPSMTIEELIAQAREILDIHDPAAGDGDALAAASTGAVAESYRPSRVRSDEPLYGERLVRAITRGEMPSRRTQSRS